MDERTTAIGIDLGTTNSCVAVYKSGSGKVEIIINNEHGHTTTPSYVSFTGDEILIGHNAKEKARRYLRNTIFDVKRLIGREFDDPNVEEDIKQWPFEVINDDNKPKIRVEVNGTFKTYCPEEISAMILRKMKETAETYLGNSVTKAVITVPAYFNDSQRQATKDAATIAGLNVLRIINEPTAAAIAYGFDKKNTKRNVLIFDLGGGTFDVSIFTLNGKNEIFEVKSTKGNTHLGGEDFNQKMVQHFVNEFQRVCEKDYSQNQSVLHSLKTECERVKKILSSAKEASIDVDSFYDGIEEFKITRACFEEMNKELFQSTLDLVEKAIKDAKLDKTQIDDVVLVGGSSRIPKIQKLLEDFFGSEKLKNKINPDEAVAYGAAVQAAILNGDQSKQIEKILLLDVTPLSLGIQDSNDEMNVVIERNTTIPARGKIAWTTSYKNQTEVIISVYEGEFRKASENHMIGQFTLEGLRNVRGTMVDIEIIMDIDANGILKVSATEKSASKRNAISITCKNGRLSKREIQRMIDKAQEDKTTESNEATRVSAKNSLESCLFEIMNTVSNEKFRNKINKTDKKLILDKCTETLHWIDSNSSTKTEQFQLKLKELEDIRAVITAMNVSNVYDPNVRYCNVLNVKKGASKTVIQDSFRLLAGKYHPDKFPGDKRIASWLFKTISDAKESLLYDANKRRRLN